MEINYLKLQAIKELSVESLLQNNWEEYYDCQIFKQGNVVHISLTVRHGTDRIILTLPQDFTPKKLICFPATIAEIDVGDNYVGINASGELSCSINVVGKLLFCNFTYKI